MMQPLARSVSIPLTSPMLPCCAWCSLATRPVLFKQWCVCVCVACGVRCAACDSAGPCEGDQDCQRHTCQVGAGPARPHYVRSRAHRAPTATGKLSADAVQGAFLLTVIQRRAPWALQHGPLGQPCALSEPRLLLCCCRPDWDATVSWLKGMGADVVTTEASLKADLGGPWP
jgi:hypothetical protein